MNKQSLSTNKYNLSTNKLLAICGPTATGKTKLGLDLAKQFKGDILSADSRQVYKGMDIITGKDLPVKSKKQKAKIKYDGKTLDFWRTPTGVRIWLTDMVGPKEEFSVAQWNRAAQLVIKKLWQEGRLPIVVGGTGFYIRALVDGIETINVPPNKALRARLSEKSTVELFDILARLDSLRAAGMNQSDWKNPRRLLRAIEIADSRNTNKRSGGKSLTPSHDVLLIGIKAPHQLLRERIADRVEVRYGKEGLGEVRDLLKQGVAWTAQSMTGLGYRRLEKFFKQEGSLEQAKKALLVADLQYAKQQLVWFKKDKRVKWFDITEPSWRSKVEKLVGNWYTTN